MASKNAIRRLNCHHCGLLVPRKRPPAMVLSIAATSVTWSVRSWGVKPRKARTRGTCFAWALVLCCPLSELPCLIPPSQGLREAHRSLHGTGGVLIMADMNAMIIYHTVSGHTKRAAEDIADGLKREGVSSHLQVADEMTTWDVANVALVLVGSPCHAGSVAFRSGLSGTIRSLLRKIGSSALACKLGGAFSVHCAYGGHRTVRAIENRLASWGAQIPEPGVVVRAGVPLSVVTGPLASEEDRRRLREFGCSLARAAKAEPKCSG